MISKFSMLRAEMLDMFIWVGSVGNFKSCNEMRRCGRGEIHLIPRENFYSMLLA